MTSLGPVPAPPSKEDLLAIFKEAIGKICREEIPQDVEPEKLWQYRMAAKNDLYWRALQYVSPNLFEGGLAAFSSVGAPIASTEPERSSTGLYDYVQNIFRGYGRKFIGAVGLRAPNVKAVPDDPDDDESQKRARTADTAAQILRAKWDIDARNLELAMHLYKSGTTFGYTPYISNAQRYGTTSQPRIESRTVPLGEATFQCSQCGAQTPESQAAPGQCPNCGAPFSPQDRIEPQTTEVPEVVGSAAYANGCVEFHLCNIFTVSTPFFVHGLEDTPWLTYEFDEYKGRLLRDYPTLRKLGNLDNFSEDSASAGVGSLVRDTAASPMGVPTPRRITRWRYTRHWLKPEMFESLDDNQTEAKLLPWCVDEQGQPSDKLRDGLKRFYPDGLKVTLVQGNLVELEAENLEDVWAYCKPETSEYLFADPLGQDMVQIQDLKNDMLNIAAETLERGLSITFVHPDTVDTEQWTQNQALPAEVIPAVPAVGSSLGDNFFQTEPAKFSEQMMPWMASVVEEAREVIGTTPSVYGGDDDQSQTAREAEIKKNAALQQLGVPWLMMRRFHAKLHTNGVKQLARWGAGQMRSVKDGAKGYESLMLNIADLKEDGWHFEAEEAIPMSWGQMRDLLMFMMEKPPQVLQAFGYNHPMNIAKNQALLGMTGYYTPGLDERDKILEVIGKLKDAKVIQKPQPDGSIDFQPTIQPDAFEDDHQLTVDMVKAWCASPEGRRIRESNPDGYANVRAYGTASMKLLQPPPQPPPPPPPKMTVTASLDKLNPVVQQNILKDFNLAPPAPPAGPGPPGPGAPPPAPGPAAAPGGPAPGGAGPAMPPPPPGPMGPQPIGSPMVQ